jgi:hypothetical protein
MITFDYDSILARLKSNLSTKLDNSGMLFFSTNQRILEAIAEELAEEMRYDEYLTNEAKWTTAQNISSIMSQTEFFGYQAHRKIGSSGNLKVSSSSSFDSSWNRTVTIPKFSQFSNGTLSFSSSSNINLLPSNTYVDVPVIQGVLRTEEYTISSSYTDDELINFVIEIENEDFENTLYEVKVNGVVWTKVDNFGESSGEDDTLFKIKTKIDFSGVDFTFGDGLTSKKLEIGDTVEIKYLETAGSESEILLTNNVTQVLSTFTDSSGRTVKLYCTNEDQLIGGMDEEDIDTIRDNAPLTFKVGSRIISRVDYLSFIQDTNLVDLVTVWGEVEINTDRGKDIGTYISTSENVVHVSALSISETTGEGIPITSSTQESIKELLEPVKSLTDLVQFTDPIITYFDVSSIIYYSPTRYSSAQAISNVQNALLEEYGIENASFKQDLYFSQYYAFLNNLDFVIYHVSDITLFQVIGVDTGNTGTNYEFEINLLHENIRPTSFSIYIKSIDSTIDSEHPYSDWYKIAEDDGLGQFTSETVPTFSGIPDSGDTFEVSFQNPLVGEFDYSSGRGIDDSSSLETIIIGKGIPSDWQSDLRVKLEFKTGTLTVDIIPTERYQLYAISSVDNIDAYPVTNEVSN